MDDSKARNIELEAADVRVGSKQVNGKTVEELGRTIGFGLQLKALFRQGQEMPVGPKTVVDFGDVMHQSGPTRRITTTLGVVYLLLLLSLAHVSAQALHLEAARAGINGSAPPTLPALLNELVQPLRW